MDRAVLIIDESQDICIQLRNILGAEFDVIIESDRNKAIQTLEDNSENVCLIILNLNIAKLDNFSLIKKRKKMDKWKDIPILGITTLEESFKEVRCLSLGINDFIYIPFVPDVVRNRVKNMADLYMKNNILEQKVRAQTEQLRSQYNILQEQAKNLKQSNQNIIDILGTVVECRNLESGVHINHIKEYTRILAEQLRLDYPEYGLTENKIEVIVNASALHDIGKIAIPDDILLKPGKLTPEEFDYMKSHTTRGCEILQNIKGIWGQDYDKHCYEICRHHHERYDGKGYPDGLVGDDIPISAQLVSLADVYDALVAERCYKEAFSKEQAYAMVLQGECGVFSPKILEAFIKTRDKIEQVQKD